MRDRITVEQALVPRALAGGGDPAWVTVPLHRAAGWSHGHDPLMPRVLLSSPDQQTMLRLRPDPDEPWWTLQHAQAGAAPAWDAAFGARTPVEIIAGLTDALIQQPGTPAEPDPYVPLLEHGWTPRPFASGLGSPDDLTMIMHAPEKGLPSWLITAKGRRNDVPLWRAWFSEHTPPHLVAGFTRALADPAPLARDPLHLPPVVSRSQITRREVPAEEVAQALEHRVQQLTARSSPPATRPRAPRVPPPHRRTR